MILQDTDVTITGVYVNSSVGASQEAYCKMQYRVQSSVTEERVLRHNSQSEPPKCYTPLSALSSMRPPVQDATTGDPQKLHLLDPVDSSNLLIKQPYPTPADYHHHNALQQPLSAPQTPYPQHQPIYHSQHMSPGSSAFCAPAPSQSQHDLTGEYLLNTQ